MHVDSIAHRPYYLIKSNIKHQYKHGTSTMAVFETIFPILAIALFGYILARKKYFTQGECDAISKFVFTYAIPSLLFISTAKATIPEDMNWEFLFSYYIVVIIIYVLSICVGKYFFQYKAAQQSVLGMGAAYSNASIIGIPICSYALGEKALLPLFIIISVHNLSLFTIGTLAAERNTISASSFIQNITKLLIQLLTHPITGSLVLGGLINILDIEIYRPLENAISLMSSAAIPMALFALGMLLNKYKIQGNITPALVIVGFKVVLFPLLVWILVFQVFSIDPLWASTALLVSAMPVGITAYIFSLKYQVCEAPIATAIVISTLSSVVTLSIVLTYIQSVI